MMCRMLFIVDVYPDSLRHVSDISIQHGDEASARRDNLWMTRDILPAGTVVTITRYDDGDTAERAHGTVIARYPQEYRFSRA
jgi:hypothetical protein